MKVFCFYWYRSWDGDANMDNVVYNTIVIAKDRTTAKKVFQKKEPDCIEIKSVRQRKLRPGLVMGV